MLIRTYVSMYIRTYVGTYLCTYICMYVCMYLRMYVCMNVCWYVCCYKFMYAYMYMNTCIACIDTYIHNTYIKAYIRQKEACSETKRGKQREICRLTFPLNSRRGV